MEDLSTIQVDETTTAKDVSKTMVGHVADNMESHKVKESGKRMNSLQQTQKFLVNTVIQEEEMIIPTRNGLRVAANRTEGQVGIGVGAEVLRENVDGVEVEVGIVEGDGGNMKEATETVATAQEMTSTEIVEEEMKI
jgi:hypothetical protein